MPPRFLLVPMSWGRGRGPVQELLALGIALRDVGAEVTFAGRPRFEEAIRAFDFDLTARLPECEDLPVTEQFLTDFAAFQGLTDASFVSATVDAERLAIERSQPDVVFSYLQPTCTVTARSLRVPHGSIARWTEHPWFGRTAIGLVEPSAATPVFNEILVRRGLPPVRDVWDLSYCWSDFKVACSTPRLEPGLEATPDIRYVGHLLHRDGVQPLTGHEHEWANSPSPRVYAYLSAKDIPLGPVRDALAALAARRVASVLVVDPSLNEPVADPPFWSLPRADGPVAVRAADVVTTTGTKTTCFEAMRAGCGLVFLPSRDEELTFWRTQLIAAGVGSATQSANPTASDLQEAIQQATGDTARRRSREQWASIERLGGPAAAADALVQFAKARTGAVA